MITKPINLKPHEVQAYLAGTKTQFRRVIKPQPFIDANNNFCTPMSNGSQWVWGQHFDGQPCTRNYKETLRYQPGQVLWARESWQIVRETLDYETGGVMKLDTIMAPRPYDPRYSR